MSTRGRKCFVAAPMNGTAVRIDVVSFAGLALGLSAPVAARHVAARQRRLAGRMDGRPAFRFGVARPEAIRFGVAGQVSQQNTLGLWANKDYPLAAVVLRLMVTAGTYRHGLTLRSMSHGRMMHNSAGRHAGKSLEAHHIGHVLRAGGAGLRRPSRHRRVRPVPSHGPSYGRVGGQERSPTIG